MTNQQYAAEYRLRMEERLGMICEDSTVKGGQRPATDADIEQARAEVAQDMDRLEREEANRG